jgi:hypothetical protein
MNTNREGRAKGRTSREAAWGTNLQETLKTSLVIIGNMVLENHGFPQAK